MMASHAARELGAYKRTTLVHLDGVLTATQGILDAALHLQQIAFTHA
jgi:hypothetical protein